MGGGGQNFEILHIWKKYTIYICHVIWT